MRLELPGYDVNYFYDSNLRTPTDKKVKKLNDFLEKNRIKGGIKLLNDGAVLEVDDSVSGEKLKEIKRMALELLRIMGATKSQLVDVFKDELDEEREIKSIKEQIAYLEGSLSHMDPKTQKEYEESDRKAAALQEYKDKLLHLTHSDEEIRQMEIKSIKEQIAYLEGSLSHMDPKTQKEYEESDRKAAALQEYKDKLLHLTHSDE